MFMHLSKIKFLSAALALSFAFLFLLGTAQTAWAQTEEDTLYTEDINQDYKVDIADIIALMIKGRNDPEDPVADYNGDGTHGITDAIALLLNIINGNLTVLVIPTYSVSGFVVLESGGGVAGIKMIIEGCGVVKTDVDGYFRIDGLEDGSYTLFSYMQNWYHTFDPKEIEVTIDGDSVVVDNIIATPADYTLTGEILEDSVGLADVSVAVLGENVDVTVTTDADGIYTVGDLLNAPYSIVPTKEGYTFTPHSLVITMVGDSTAPDIIATSVDTTLTLYLVSGRVSCSVGPLDNITVSLSGDQEAATVTDGNGLFSFYVPDGAYMVYAEPVPLFQAMNPSSYSNVVVDGADVADLNFYGFGTGL
jgi:hypothetical protein